MKVLPEGTEITCPQCHKVMLVVKKDLYSGNVIGEDFFIKKEHNVKKGDKLVCPYDGTPYSGSRLVTQIHTKDGWV